MTKKGARGSPRQNPPDRAGRAIPHGGTKIGDLRLRSYNIEIKDEDGFIGDKASGKAFRSFVQDWRLTLREMGKDPFDEPPGAPVSRKRLGQLLATGDSDAAAIIHGAIEDYGHHLADVIARYLGSESWQGVSQIVVGGGLSRARVGQLAVARAKALLLHRKIAVKLHTIRHDPDEAGLLGSLYVAPDAFISDYDGIIGVDIGGSNIRCGIVFPRLQKDGDLKQAVVSDLTLWRHEGRQGLSRDKAVAKLGRMIKRLIRRSTKREIALAPFLGIACPGVIDTNGGIKRGAQNLPGDWEAPDFRLPDQLLQMIPKIGDHAVLAVMHNDAVIQGLSEYPWLKDVRDWGVLTIGTGLGNAAFHNARLKQAA